MNPTAHLFQRMRHGGGGSLPRSGHRPHRRQRGVVLFTSLILLMILTMVGVMLSRMQTVEEQISQNDQNHQMAVQAAEATLRYAEGQLGIGPESAANCVNDTNGMYTWQTGTPDEYVTYQTQYTGSASAAVLAYGSTPLPVTGTPVFLVECMPGVYLPGSSLSAPPTAVFRITAYSYGGDSTAHAELQDIVW